MLLLFKVRLSKSVFQKSYVSLCLGSPYANTMKLRDRTKKKEPAKCKECEDPISADDRALDCDVCKEFICLNCTELDDEVYTYLMEKEVDVPFMCKPCKSDIPKIRELMGLKEKYNALNQEMDKLKTDLATQKVKFQNQEENMKTLTERLAALENRPVANAVDFPNLLDANQPQQIQQFVNTHLRPVLQNEISEHERIHAIKKNLICSGIKESEQPRDADADREDKAAFINLMNEEFNIVPDVEKVERCGKKRTPTDEDPHPKPRLLKIFLKDLRTKKLILSKAVTLRNSENDYTKNEIYIRPDQTLKQQEESKNLRDQLKLRRQQNPAKTFKIKRGIIVEIEPEPAEGEEEHQGM